MNSDKIIVIKKEDKIALGWFLILMGIGSLVMVGIMFYGLFFDNHDGKRIDDYLTVLIPLLIATFIIFQAALWRINGKDIIKFNSEYLTIQSKGALFHLKPKLFHYDNFLRVEKIEIDVLKIEKNMLTLKGLDGHRKFGQGISLRNLNPLYEKLNKLIEEKRKFLIK